MSQTMREALQAAANYIDTLGGDSKRYRCVLASSEQAQQGAERLMDELEAALREDGYEFAHQGPAVCAWIEGLGASRPAAAAPTAEQILALERRSPMSDDEALRFGRAVLLLAERAAAAAPAVGVTALREALQFYANGDHFTKHDPNAWDNVSGEPANLWEDEANTATVEDGSIARAALAGAAQPRCPHCDGTGDVHSPDGQWRGVCTCPAGAAQGAEPVAWRGALEEIASMEYDKWSNGARAGEIARNALAMQSQPIPVTGATVADRLDALADREQAGSQAASDLYAAATIWRKHLKAGVAQGAEPAMSQAARDVLAERQRQISAEGWTPEHDDEHAVGELAQAAACYAISNKHIRWNVAGDVWLWGWKWKPAGERRNLLKAGALILAEIERLDRAASPTPPTGTSKEGGEHGA